MDRSSLISAGCLVLAALYCFFPLVVSITMLMDLLFGTQASELFDIAVNFLSGSSGADEAGTVQKNSGSSVLTSMIVPILGAITIFQKDKLLSVISILIIFTFTASFVLCFVAFAMTYSNAVVDRLGYAGDLQLVLRSFLESSSLYILILFGIKSFDGGAQDKAMPAPDDPGAIAEALDK